jgi:hypothetical protein
LKALDIVGGVGESILFGLLPGVILIKLAWKRSKTLVNIGLIMVLISSAVTIFVLLQKFGVTHLMVPK